MVEPEGFRAAMKQLASGLVVITTWVDGRPWGMAVTACCSLSAEPALVLVSLHGRTRSRAAIHDGARFGVNILGAGQKHVAEAAARPGRPKYLDEHCVADAHAAPRIAGALASLDCVALREIDVADHTLVVGSVEQVVAAPAAAAAAPLVYFDRSYRTIGEEL